MAAQVLPAAAVIGRSFDLETVQAAAGRSEEEAVEGLKALLRRRVAESFGRRVGRQVDAAAQGAFHYRWGGEEEEAMAQLKQAVALFAEIGEPGALPTNPEIWKLAEW